MKVANHEVEIKFSVSSWISIRWLTVLTVDSTRMAFLERALYFNIHTDVNEMGFSFI